jgi:hypothetical protein
LRRHRGHFLREDPLSFTAGDTNLYRYVFNNPVSYVDPTGLSWWDKVKSFGRGLWNGFTGFFHEAIFVPMDFVGTTVDTFLGVVDYGFGTNLSFGYEARSYYGQALEDRLRHGDLDGFWDLAETTALDLLFLGVPSTYIAIEEAVTEGNLEPLGEVIGGYGAALGLRYAGRYGWRCIQLVVPRAEPAGPTTTQGRPVIIAKDGTVVRGLTKHGIDRVIGGYKREGVAPRPILDALKNPIEIVKGIDSDGRPFVKYIGKNATVVVNPETGLIVSVWPR